MPSNSEKGRPQLIDLIDEILDKHGATNPELKSSLSSFRAKLKEELEQGRKKDAAQSALQFVSLLGFLRPLG